MTDATHPTHPARPRRDVWLTAGLVAVMVLGLAGLAAATGWQETWASIGRLTPGQVALLLLLALANYMLRALRWQLYCRVQRIPVTFRQTLRHYLGGFAMTATPGRVGELVRLRWITQETGTPLERCAALVVVDRAADLAAIGLLTAVAVAFSTAGLAGGLPVAVLSVVAAIMVTRASLLTAALELGWRLLGRWPRLFGRARRAAQALRPFSAWQVVLPALALGGLGWLAEGLSFHLLLGWMGAEVSLWTAVGIFLIAMVTGGATGAPGGLGGAEAAMVALLTLEGVPLSVSIPATAVIRLTTLWFAIAIGLAMFPLATRAATRGAHAA
ncbi:flippase-like domain-containing protein [Rhodobacteraceae bacterium 2CG4]|uniref:Flippase-like domain-containing protein n=1 Tax=Halovulum marinum TaxID=2662447 RepID=A0A6L5YVQ7_9RHOB|nr:lysylphosphatidylglycerol synthase transmembrane domain-containing protein [Halovulum marinum]MSU88381.1 flippase-like domain-containing protein [Halovulum marinum]